MAFQTLRRFGQESKEHSEDVAAAVGRYAKRNNIPEKELYNWLQSAYGNIWVKLSGLNPGLDFSEIRKIVFQFYKKV